MRVVRFPYVVLERFEWHLLVLSMCSAWSETVVPSASFGTKRTVLDSAWHAKGGSRMYVLKSEARRSELQTIA